MQPHGTRAYVACTPDSYVVVVRKFEEAGAGVSFGCGEESGWDGLVQAELKWPLMNTDERG